MNEAEPQNETESNTGNILKLKESKIQNLKGITVKNKVEKNE